MVQLLFQVTEALVFGELIDGFEVISKISNVTRDKNNLPKQKVIMNISVVK